MFLKSKKVIRTIQVIFGLILIFFALNAFFQFSSPPAFNEAATAFLTALFNTGYILPLMALAWLIAGILYIINRWSALATILIFPITVNILLFHLLLDSTGTLFALIFVILNIYFIIVPWQAYKPLFKGK